MHFADHSGALTPAMNEHNMKQAELAAETRPGAANSSHLDLWW